MTAYRISEAARLVGFAPSALRFYEGAGLLPPPARTSSGYRTYDDAAIERLRFVHRARELGVPLAEVRALVAGWDAGQCAPVQQHLALRVAARRDRVRAQIDELQALHKQLDAAQDAVLATSDADVCGPGCACLAEPGPEPEPDHHPLVCVLDPAELPARTAAWRNLVSRAARREAVPDGQRLVFDPTPGLAAEISVLCEQELQCCSFFAFRVEQSARHLQLDVTAPARDLVADLFGAQA